MCFPPKTEIRIKNDSKSLAKDLKISSQVVKIFSYFDGKVLRVKDNILL